MIEWVSLRMCDSMFAKRFTYIDGHTQQQLICSLQKTLVCAMDLEVVCIITWSLGRKGGRQEEEESEETC